MRLMILFIYKPQSCATFSNLLRMLENVGVADIVIQVAFRYYELFTFLCCSTRDDVIMKLHLLLASLLLFGMFGRILAGPTRY